MSPLLGPRTSPRAGMAGSWVIIPTGSCEAHGPHLPLDTDVRISEEMAVRAARIVGNAVVVPTLPYGVTHYAGAFPGTISVPPEVVIGTLVAIGDAAAAQGAVGIAIANSHFEPAHIDAIFEGVKLLKARLEIPVVFPNVASRRYAARLGVEFASGACHAGAYESSMVLAMAPELVDETARAGLPEVPIDLAAAMRAGAHDFVGAGGTRAYFGAPAAATAAEGDGWLDVLAMILAEAIRAG